MDTHQMEVAETMLRQLGGRRFQAMTGARHFTASEDALSFRLPSRFAKDGINAVRIVLEPSDTYTVTFSRIRGTSVVEVSKHEDVYCDMLRDIFEHATGLRTNL